MPRVKRGVTAHARHKKTPPNSLKVTAALAHAFIALPSKLLLKRVNTLSATVASKNAIFARCGSCASTHKHALKASATANLLPV